VGGDHLRTDHPDRRHRGGDLARSLRGARLADEHAVALPHLHPVRRDPDACAHRDPGPDEERRTDSVANSDCGADRHTEPHCVQPGARQLPNPAVAAHRDAEPDTHPDRSRDDAVSDDRTDADPDPDGAAELDAAADCDTDAVTRSVAVEVSARRSEREEEPAAVLGRDRRALQLHID
jgi:hypothetical protein